MASLLPQPKQLFQDNAWNPLVGGQIFTYAAGTLTPKATYQDSALTVLNTNPVVVNARGEALMFGDGAYRIIAKDSSGNTLYDVDNVESASSLASTAVSSIRSDLASTTDVAKGDALIGIKRTLAQSIATTLHLWNEAQWLNVKADFGAKGDGSTADTVAFQAALDVGGAIYVPPGTYILAALTATKPFKLVGSGRDSAILSYSGNINLLSISGFSGGWQLHDFSVKHTGAAATSGFAIDINGAANGQAQNLYIDSPYVGIRVQASQNCKFNAVDVWYYVNAGYLLTGNSNNDCFFSKGFLNGESAPGAGTAGLGSGIRLEDKCEAITFDSMEVVLSRNPLSTDATSYTAGNRPAYCRFTNCFFDSSTDGVLLDKCVDFKFIGCWFSNRPNSGCVVNQVDTVSFTDSTFANCANHGCIVQSTAVRVSFQGCKFLSNGTAAANTYSGVVFSGASDWQVIGCTATNANGLSNVQAYGVTVTGAADRYTIADNLFSGNLSGGISNAGTGLEQYIANNTGYRTSNGGTAGVTFNASGLGSIAHGLAVTPKTASVFAVNSGVDEVMLVGIDATNLNLRLRNTTSNANSTGSYNVNWRAQA